MRSTDDTVDVIEKMKREYQTTLFLLGCASTEALRHNHSLIEQAEFL